MIWRVALIVAFLAIVSVPSLADNQKGQSCSPSGRVSDATKNGATDDGNSLVCVSGTWQYPAYALQSAAASAGASCSTYPAGAMRYNTTSQYIEFCNGSNWSAMVTTQATAPPTAPAGSGYFVITQTTYNGNLGGYSGGNAKCLTELATTHTTWNGYSSANSRGLLNSSHVFAWLDGSQVILMPLTTYYFADAADVTHGGASFTTDSSGRAPNDNAVWSAANRFGGTYSYIGIYQNGNANYATAGNANNCSTWADSTASSQISVGVASNSDYGRWYTGTTSCNNTYRMICYINP